MGGCSWLPGKSHDAGRGHAGQYAGHYGAQHQAPLLGGQFGGPYGSPHAAPAPGHCQIPHAQAPVPPGCDPAAVTVGLGTFAQSPQFGGGYGAANYATGGYGGAVGGRAIRYADVEKTGALRKPKWRGQLSVGVEKSLSGNFFDFDASGNVSPDAFYNPAAFFEGFVEGSAAEGQIRTIDYTSVEEEVLKPTISQDDVYSTPLSVSAGLEYIVSPRTTLFGRAGYTTSEGNAGNVVQVNAELRRTVGGTDFITGEVTDPNTGEVTSVTTAVPIPPQTTFLPNVENVAAFAFDFTDLRRIDLEAGARHYFDPLKNAGLHKVSPFVAASAGAAHFNGAAFKTTQTQAFLERSFNDQSTASNLYEVIPSQAPSERTEIYDDQWVPRGAINAGLEWQATPRTALAFETGIQVEGGRKYSNGEREDENISIPFTIRGSYNF